jgi:hypothetical protein
VSFELASLAGAQGSVTGIDMDEVKLALAREAATERGFAKVEFRAGNVNDWAEPSAYDFVYCRFLLQHLSRPVGLLARMWEAVRPGGAIAVEDTDYEGLFCDPPNDGVAFHKRMYPRLVEQNGGDALIGRKLYRYFLQAGIPDPGVRVAQAADAKGEAKSVILLTLRGIAESLVNAGLASAEEVAAAIEDLAAFTRRRTPSPAARGSSRCGPIGESLGGAGIACTKQDLPHSGSWRTTSSSCTWPYSCAMPRGWRLPVRMTSRHHWLGRCPARLHTSCCTTSSPPAGAARDGRYGRGPPQGGYGTGAKGLRANGLPVLAAPRPRRTERAFARGMLAGSR